MKEQDLYPGVVSWVQSFLKERHRRFQVMAEDTSRSRVRDFLQNAGLFSHFEGAETFEIAVDVTGAAWREENGKIREAHLIIVEVKLGEINLREFSQLLGYARVVQPSYAFIVSPRGWSGTIAKLVKHFNRTDILEYANGRHIVVARWNVDAQNVRPGDTLVPSHFPGGACTHKA